MRGQRLRGRKAAVTGAGGFIGNAICRRLAVEGAEVLGLDVNPETSHRVAAWVMLVVFCLPIAFYVLRLVLDVLGR